MSQHRRCPQCRKPVLDGQASVTRCVVGGGSTMTRRNQSGTYVWHAECHAAAERDAVESRRAARELHEQTLREMHAALPATIPTRRNP